MSLFNRNALRHRLKCLALRRLPKEFANVYIPSCVFRKGCAAHGVHAVGVDAIPAVLNLRNAKRRTIDGYDDSIYAHAIRHGRFQS